MALEDVVRRGNRAKQVLDADVYQEAWRAYEQRLLDEIANADRSDEQAKQLRALLIAVRKAKAHLERIMRDGEAAAHEIELMEKQKGTRNIFRRA